MKVAIIGTGYVGLPTGVGLAELGHDVVCIDKDVLKIQSLQEGKVTLYEEGLEEMLVKNYKNKKIRFTASMKEGVSGASIVIIAVGTPIHSITKEADMQYIYAAVSELAEYIEDYVVIANKSTVPVGTGDKIEKIIRQSNSKARFDVVSLPEFLREGFAIYDFFNLDRIVVGTNSQKAKGVIDELYSPFENKIPILYVNRRSSETIKYASNAFLAVKIHYINEMANFCEQVGADISEVSKGVGLDSRIGSRFLNPGPGYGGSCFPKDTMAMSYMAKQNGVELTLIDQAIKGNLSRKREMAKRVLEAVKDIKSPKIAILGLSFKDGTDDCRESPAIEIIEELLKSDARIVAYDPKAIDTAKLLLGDKIVYADDTYRATKDADVLVILTEWKEFGKLDLDKVAKLMKNKEIIDCRNMLDKKEVEKLGFVYRGIGK